jgi:hypothetical protein
MSEKASPRQIRMAQDLAVELGHLNKGIKSLYDLYYMAPELLNALKRIAEAPLNNSLDMSRHELQAIAIKAIKELQDNV